MSLYCDSKLRSDGELNWVRNVWDDLLLPTQWMELITLQKDGYTHEDVDALVSE